MATMVALVGSGRPGLLNIQAIKNSNLVFLDSRYLQKTPEMLSNSVLASELLIAYMYYRYKFGWNDILFGSYMAYRNISSFLGTLLILNVLKRRLKISDEVVGAVSCISGILSLSVLIAARSTLFVFIVPIIGIISQGSMVVQRPILNRQIVPNEQGKIYSVLGALETATQTFTSPLFSLLYKKTVQSMPDAWLFPLMTVSLIEVIIYIVTKRYNTNTQPNKKSDKLGQFEDKKLANCEETTSNTLKDDK